MVVREPDHASLEVEETALVLQQRRPGGLALRRGGALGERVETVEPNERDPVVFGVLRASRRTHTASVNGVSTVWSCEYRRMPSAAAYLRTSGPCSSRQ